ncbi:uridylate-specific endoribonuclease-like [Clavelina lepadiformis]|uniref:uridylate-specific endoribonuclease-like n=1 Tax=Clavelina lepadiformis TaxID=159417 RepID=UPI0040420EE9
MLKLFMFCLAVVGLVVGQSLRKSSCVDRCGIRFDRRLPCQCNKKCPIYGNCCPDYSTKCELTNSKRCQTSEVTQNDLSSISLKLYDLDVNRASPDDYVINPQAMTTSWHLRDMSPNRFFTSVNQNLLNKPTYQALINLLDNYEMIQGKDEYVTRAETDEIYTFLNAFMSTSIGRKLYEFLSEKGLSGCENKITFIENLKKMWFDLYSRGSHGMDTSGFEHVFVGEIKGSKVSGLHNWVQIYLQENSRRLNYYGYPGKAEPSFYYVRFE